MIIFLISLSEIERDFVGKLYKRLNLKMYKIAIKILKDKFDAEEAVSNTFIKIMKNIKKIMNLPCPQIDPYCVTILKNESFNIIQEGKKSINIEDIDLFFDFENNFLLEEEIILNLDIENLIVCVNTLKKEERKLITLRFLEKLGYKQIGEIYGISEEAAKKRGQRILAKLKECIEAGEKNVK